MTNMFDTYQEGTHKTAIYPKEPTLAMAYLVMGLANEFSEYGNAPTRELAIKEVGDLFWFTSELATLIDASLSALFDADPGLNELGQAWNIPAGDVAALGVFAQELLDICGACAKHIRDGSSYHEKMFMFLSRLVKTLDSMCDIMGVETSEVLTENLEKLQSRQKRGVLGGSGDNR